MHVIFIYTLSWLEILDKDWRGWLWFSWKLYKTNKTDSQRESFLAVIFFFSIAVIHEVLISYRIKRYLFCSQLTENIMTILSFKTVKLFWIFLPLQLGKLITTEFFHKMSLGYAAEFFPALAIISPSGYFVK